MHQHGRKNRRVRRTVEVSRGRTGYGFTISGEHPCRLGGIVPGSSADRSGLEAGDRLLAIDGSDVTSSSHDEVVRRIGLSRGVIRLDISERSAESSSEDSTDDDDDDEELIPSRQMRNGMRPRSRPILAADRRVMGSPSWNKPGVNSVGSKYSRRVGRNGVVEHFFGPSEGNCNIENIDVNVERPSGSQQCRKSKHTVITREARLGIDRARRSDERRRPIGNDSPSCVDAYDCPDGSFLLTDELQVMVGYSGSVEMPSDAPKLAGSRLQSIRSAVQRLRAAHRKRTLVVMDIDAEGIRLTDASCRIVACYVTERIAFCGICPDDRRFFGIVMTSGADGIGYCDVSGSSCHVFMVDPELADHRVHASTASRFGLNCTMDLDTDRCLEFPTSAAPVISFLGRLYRQRKSVPPALAPLNGAFFYANSRHACDGREQEDRVCVVDVPKHDIAGRPRSDADGDSVDESFIHDLSAIQPIPCTKSDRDNAFISSHSVTRQMSDRRSVTTSQLTNEHAQISKEAVRPSALRLSESQMRRGTSALDEMNSADNLRRSIRRFLPPDRSSKSQGRHQLISEEDTDSNTSIQSSTKSSVICQSPFVPPPPLPPRVTVSRTDSDAFLAPPSRSIAVAESQPAASQTNMKLTPSFPRKSGSDDSGSVNQLQFSASKPPLPERRPTSTRPGQRVAIPALKKDIYDRPKSTPPVDVANELSLAVPAETTNYDSDPGERTNEQLDLAHETDDDVDDNNIPCASAEYLSIPQSTDALCGIGSGTVRSGSSTGIASAVSCKMLTNVGVERGNIGHAASWAVHFDRLLADCAGRATFAEFLQTEFSAENLTFWLHCEEYKKLTDAQQRKLLAADLVRSHFLESATDPVNVDGSIRQTVIENVSAATPDLFDAAQKQIYLLMKQDSYVRFLKSDVYKQSVIAEMEGRSLPHPGTSMSATKPKLESKKLMKKSRSTAAADETSTDEKRRKSLLPWSRNKSDKKFGKSSRTAYIQKSSSGSTPASEGSSLSHVKGVIAADQVCRVTLPDGSVHSVQISGCQTVEMMLTKLGSKLQTQLDLLDPVIISDNDQQTVSMLDDCRLVASREIRLERCGVFRLDVTGTHRTVAVRARIDKRIQDVLRPILLRCGVDMDDVILHIAGTGVILAEDALIASVDGRHVLAQSLEEVKGKKRKDGALLTGRPSLTRQRSAVFSSNISLTEQLKNLFNGVEGRISFSHITFDDLGVWNPDKAGDGKKEEGRHSGLFGFIRRTSVGDKKATGSTPTGPTNNHQQQQLQHTLSAAASNVTPVARIQQNTDERRLFELLKRVQNRQYDDQRGTSLTAFKEMPEFLQEPSPSADGAESSRSNNSEGVDPSIGESRIEVCRGDDIFEVRLSEVGGSSRFSLSPSQCLRQTATFSDDDDSIMPSHENAEQYFSQNPRSGIESSPDFTDPRLMERSVRDLGFDSPACKSNGSRGWSLIGNVSAVPRPTLAAKMSPDDAIFAVPSAPPLRIYRRNASSSNARFSPAVDAADRQRQTLKLDDLNEDSCSSSGSTPSPRTHDMILVGSECVVTKTDQITKRLAPLVDPEESDADEVYGVV